MGRPQRRTCGGIAYHALNRGNGRARIFHKEGDYFAFEKAIREAMEVVPMRVLGYCLMPNHWHLVLWPMGDGDLSRFVGWLTNTHVKRYRSHYDDLAGGHLYQGRFRSFPIQEDIHLLRVLRYVEANPLRANLAPAADGWQWSSFWVREHGRPDGLLNAWPVECPSNWRELVERPLCEEELVPLRTSITRGRPYGTSSWAAQVAATLGISASLRPLGRPRHPQFQL